MQCDEPYHLGCLSPPLSETPEGQWFCPVCEKDEGPLSERGTKSPEKRARDPENVDDGGHGGDEEVEVVDVKSKSKVRSESFAFR